MLAREAVAGGVWFTDHHHAPMDLTVAAAEKLIELTADGPLGNGRQAAENRASRYSRQALLFGAEGQAKMRRLRVGVTGAGGIGMLIIQSLSRLGVGEFVIIDPDTVSTSNLSRLPETHPRDATGRLGLGPIGRLAKHFGLASLQDRRCPKDHPRRQPNRQDPRLRLHLPGRRHQRSGDIVFGNVVAEGVRPSGSSGPATLMERERTLMPPLPKTRRGQGGGSSIVRACCGAGRVAVTSTREALITASPR